MQDPEVRINLALASLPADERDTLTLRARVGPFGGTPVKEAFLREKLADMGLVYWSTGRLWPLAYRLLRA